jgi:hypothetical protein
MGILIAVERRAQRPHAMDHQQAAAAIEQGTDLVSSHPEDMSGSWR